MRKVEVLSELREALGNPEQARVPDRKLMPYVLGALDWLARELKYSLRTDTVSLALVGGQYSYDLPGDVSEIQWLRIGTTRLSPTTTFLWNRDGIDYQNNTAGMPAEFAFEGRQIIFDRAVSASVITSYPRASYKYVSSSPGISPSGIPRLPDTDVRLAIAYAAWRYCGANPSQENAARQQTLSQVISMDLRSAKERHGAPIEDLQPSFAVDVSRMPAAR